MRVSLLVFFSTVLIVTHADASGDCAKYNYAERKAYILNFSPGLQLTGFDFCNTTKISSYSATQEFIQNFSWKNVGNIPVVSYEVDTIKFDPFNRELIGSKMIIPGTDSAHWTPLAPGQVGSDGAIGHGHENVYTAIGYISAVRYADGTVWTVDRDGLATSVKAIVKTFEDKDFARNEANNSLSGSQASAGSR
jgi:hypothetical protein